jgi:hypothetical protein
MVIYMSKKGERKLSAIIRPYEICKLAHGTLEEPYLIRRAIAELLARSPTRCGHLDPPLDYHTRHAPDFHGFCLSIKDVRRTQRATKPEPSVRPHLYKVITECQGEWLERPRWVELGRAGQSDPIALWYRASAQPG